jgi:hypothetical protein
MAALSSNGNGSSDGDADLQARYAELNSTHEDLLVLLAQFELEKESLQDKLDTIMSQPNGITATTSGNGLNGINGHGMMMASSLSSMGSSPMPTRSSATAPFDFTTPQPHNLSSMKGSTIDEHHTQHRHGHGDELELP